MRNGTRREQNFRRVRIIISVLFCGNVLVDILAAEEGVENHVNEHGEDDHIADAQRADRGTDDGVLDQRQDTAADDHHHEDTGSFLSILSKSLSRQVEDATPHDGGAKTHQYEEHGEERHVVDPLLWNC